MANPNLDDAIELLTPLGDGSQIPNGPIYGRFAGHAVRVSRATHKGSTTELTLAVEAALPIGAAVKFAAEGMTERTAKYVGLSVEPEAGDPEFDARVYVESENDECAVPLIFSDPLRGRIRGLLESLGAAALEIGPTGVTLSIPHHADWEPLFSKASIAELLKSGIAIHGEASKALALFEAGPVIGSAGRTPAWKSRKPEGARLPLAPGIAAVLFGGGLVLFVAGFWFPTLTAKLQAAGLTASLLAVPAFAIYAFRDLRGRSRSHKEFGCALAMAVPGILFCLVAGPATMNGALSIGRGETVVVGRVTGKRISKGKNSTTYYVVVSIRTPTFEGPVEYKIGRYDQYAVGQELGVRLHAGILGEPWVAGLDR